VGQYQYMHDKGFKQYYRRAGDRGIFQEQALRNRRTGWNGCGSGKSSAVWD
jgi:hypothetical protein